VRLLAFAALLLAAPAILQAQPIRGQPIAIEGQAVQGGLVRGHAPAGTVALSLGDHPVAVAADGAFLIGLDRDHPATARLTARLGDGRVVEQLVPVAPRAWRIEHINVARSPGGITDEAYRLRRESEVARIAAARAQASPSEGWRQHFVWPSRGRISGQFGAQRVYRGSAAAYHSGVDVAPGAGAPVVAPADGIVVLAGPPMFSLEGNLVIIDHGMGLNSAFLHLARADVAVGQRVRQGQAIGTVGATGRATGPHLHWSLMWNGARLDPQLVAGPMR
jgi:murein DD-endopeptidase MepM/ murein hydrolase activator NlpD